MKTTHGFWKWSLLWMTLGCSILLTSVAPVQAGNRVESVGTFLRAYNVMSNYVLYGTPMEAFNAYVPYRQGCSQNQCIQLVNFRPQSPQYGYFYGSVPMYWNWDELWSLPQTGQVYDGVVGAGYVGVTFTGCPAGFDLNRHETGSPSSTTSLYESPTCDRLVPDLQPPVCDCITSTTKPVNGAFGDPIFPQDGTSRTYETDYQDKNGLLTYTRVYSSDRMSFASNYAVPLLPPAPTDPVIASTTQPTPSGGCYYGLDPLGVPHCWPYVGVPGEVQLRTPTGMVLRLTWDGATATPVNSYLTDQLTMQGAGASALWLYHENRSGRTLTFNAAGILIRIDERNGRFQTLAYASGSTTMGAAAPQLTSVTDNFNRSLQFTYDGDGNLLTMTDPAGHVTSYGYDGDANNPNCSGLGCRNLVTVTYPDGGVRTYHWNESGNLTRMPSSGSYALLTGITDENGQRYADTTYDGSTGYIHAVSTWLGGGVNRYTISNYTQYQSATVTDPFGTARNFTYGNAQGLVKLASVTGGACPECEAQAQTFDANGNVASRTDFNGVTTNYTYDLTRNLETIRTEAAGTAQARTISTIWHPTLSLPAQITEPNRVTSFAYDGNGNLLSKSVTASGKTRNWNYTYNNFGQVLTATDPDSNKTNWTYDTSGNLTSLTDAAGHVTRYTSYDANGNLLSITDPNGKTSTLTWDVRNRLKSRQDGSDLTSYVYDPVGQLIQVTLPDSSTITYSYDPAHRLTGISDSHGNGISYTLDAMGNHTREDVIDPAGQLAAARQQVTTSQQIQTGLVH